MSIDATETTPRPEHAPVRRINVSAATALEPPFVTLYFSNQEAAHAGVRQLPADRHANPRTHLSNAGPMPTLRYPVLTSDTLPEQLEIFTRMGVPAAAAEAAIPLLRRAIAETSPFHAIPPITGLATNHIHGGIHVPTGHHENAMPTPAPHPDKNNQEKSI